MAIENGSMAFTQPVETIFRAAAHDSIRLMRFLMCCILAFCITVPSFLIQAQDTDTVLIVGEVKHEGRFPAKQSISLLDLIRMAGGFTARADRHAIEIIHNGMAYTIDFENILMNRIPPVQIEIGDTVRVPMYRGHSPLK